MKDTNLRKSLLISFILHLVILSIFSLNPPTISEAKTIEVKLISPLSTISESRIVPDSEAKEVDSPPISNRLSAKNTISPVETLKRGQEDGGVKISNEKITSASQTTSKKVEHPKPKLRLSEGDLLDKFSKKKSPEIKELKKSDSERQSEFFKAKPFRRSSIAQIGSSVHLPNIPDGEVTLLNSKADQNAVFVRRVALQVFGSLKQKNWESLSHSEVKSIGQPARIHAVMSPDGDLVRVEIEKSSGSISFDLIAEAAAKAGTWDKNPPEKAFATDGNIHFIFQTRTWARFIGDKAIERRWLLLGTGLL